MREKSWHPRIGGEWLHYERTVSFKTTFPVHPFFLERQNVDVGSSYVAEGVQLGACSKDINEFLNHNHNYLLSWGMPQRCAEFVKSSK